ncbi:uncharacterized protein LOC112571189 isoform X2 [Pomacea canaliculata]|uniref:uncharacterized protein LOC112571189 isoform X2 n=1 Tax=Pomacea canaliculata TaxID=400727 RepID=UPI000D73A79D|nr:uncharacterized protein LOC112571189 isoform X2 [Pomacea canaliculata]
MAAAPSWDEFVTEHLLQSGLFSGVCLLSPQGESIYTYGSLQHLFKDDAQQFLRAFRTISKKAEEETIQKGFHLSLDLSLKNKVFKIYHKTYTSIYSVSTDNQMGLLVSKLPYAVMVCVYSSPVTSAKAVKQLEYFCDKMHS